MKLLKNKGLLFCIIVFQLGCESSHSISKAQIVSEINKYYESEREGDWKYTYECRSKRFKEVVDYSVYEEVMIEDREKWKPTEYEIVSVSIETSEVVADIKFVETLRQKKGESGSPPLQFRGIETTKWFISESGLICHRPGVRYHYSLNRDVE